LSVVFLAQFVLQRQKDAADRKRERAEKFEELVGAVTEHYHAIGALRFFAISGQGESQPTLSSMAKIEAITITYFPEFEGSIQQFFSASNEDEMWILSTGQKRLRSEPGFEKLAEHDEVLTKYTHARMIFLGI
jgi:hypothetical protein